MSNLLARPGWRQGKQQATTKALGLERTVAKSERAVEKYGDVDHQIKKVRLSGMQAHADKIIVDTINTQIKNLKENGDVYKSVHGETAYNELLASLINKMTGTMNNRETTPLSALASTLSNGEQISLLDDNDDNDEDK